MSVKGIEKILILHGFPKIDKYNKARKRFSKVFLRTKRRKGLEKLPKVLNFLNLHASFFDLRLKFSKDGGDPRLVFFDENDVKKEAKTVPIKDLNGK